MCRHVASRPVVPLTGRAKPPSFPGLNMCRIVLAALVCMAASPALADDAPAPNPPIARFELEDGWVNVSLERDGKPVPNARMKVLVDKGAFDKQLWAEGELEDVGRGTFPRPPGKYCQVVFDLGDGPVAPIPLNFLSDGLVPTESPVRDGKSVCCLVPSRGTKAEDVDGPNWREPVVIGVAVLVVNGVVIGWVLSRSRQSNRT